MTVWRIRILVLAGCLAVGPCAWAQAPAPQQPQAQTSQQTPAKPAAESNPFPEDSNAAPVISHSAAEAAAAAGEASSGSLLPVPESDGDPARSPDDAGADTASHSEGGFSSSMQGGDMPDIRDTPDRAGRGHRKLSVPDPVHTETAEEDVSVGAYYLERKNWKAALSRYESALVLAPENPDVYWGLAESERRLGNYAAAKKHYETVIEYDPDSRHAREAKKLLKEPELVNPSAAPAVQPAQAPAFPAQPIQ